MAEIRFYMKVAIVLLGFMIADGLWKAGYVHDAAQIVANRSPRGLVEPDWTPIGGCGPMGYADLKAETVNTNGAMCWAHGKCWPARADGLCYIEDENQMKR